VCVVVVLRRNCLIRQVIKGEVEVTRRRGRRRKKLLDDLRGRERIMSYEGGGFKSHYVEGIVLEETLGTRN
jgi:hypothetical protein